MLKKSVPLFVAEMLEIAELFHVEQAEMDRLEISIIRLIEQFYMKSASYSLDEWEREFALEKNSLLTESQRRARILGKMNSNPPATIKMIENLVLQILGANYVFVREYPAEYRFVIYVNTDYLVESLSIADAAVKEMRPAHLNYKFINQLIRTAGMTACIGIAGGRFFRKEGVVNTDALYIDQ